MSLVPNHIRNLLRYKAGKPIDEVKRELGLDNVIKLASNENPLGPSLKSIQAIQDSVKNISIYPDSNGFYLRKKLSEIFSLNIDNVVLGSGSEGIMATIMRTFLNESDHILAAKNSFIGFRVLANASGRQVDWVPMENYSYNLIGMAKNITDKTKIIYLANPDNPTGSYFTTDEFNDFMAKVPERCLIILDEAYYEYASSLKNYPDSMNYRYDNVITLRTFSKAYGLAGLRVGYGFAHKDLVSNIMKVKLPFEPSVLAQAAAIEALDDYSHIEKTLKNNLEQMDRVIEVFKKINLKYIPSAANFITVIFDSECEAKSFSDKFLENGIILRHLKSFGLPECVRITIGSEIEMRTFIDRLEIVLEYV